MMLFRSLTVSVACITLLFTAACHNNMQGNVVSSQSSAGKVAYGKVVSSRAVTIKDTKKLQENTLGGAAGGVAGGLAGNSFGRGTGNGLATAGGAIAGAVLGALIQDQLSTQQGQEYIVKLEGKAPKTKTNRRKTSVSRTKNAIESELADSVTSTEVESDAISVIQTDTQPIAVGTKVMVVYRDDGVRIVPAF